MVVGGDREEEGVSWRLRDLKDMQEFRKEGSTGGLEVHRSEAIWGQEVTGIRVWFCSQ